MDFKIGSYLDVISVSVFSLTFVIAGVRVGHFVGEIVFGRSFVFVTVGWFVRGRVGRSWRVRGGWVRRGRIRGRRVRCDGSGGGDSEKAAYNDYDLAMEEELD